MSHLPERKEKNCLNCGAIVQGRFCHQCGQENVVPKETFWHMVKHFFYDVTHFDSSFFHSIHHLLFKPGFLSKEYMDGRRASYLHPIRMYVFTSAIFFLLFFTFFRPEVTESSPDQPITRDLREVYLRAMTDSLEKDSLNGKWKNKIKCAEDTSCKITIAQFREDLRRNNFISLGGTQYESVKEYDSMQSLLPPEKRDGWLGRRITTRVIHINEKYKEDPDEADRKLVDGVLHKLPYMLFFSLPLFALILKLVYFRRKKFYFADHGVFTIHLYVFSFIVLLLVFSLSLLQNVVKGNFLLFVYLSLFLVLFAHLFLGMKKFYEQGWGKTFLKFLIVAIVSLVMMLILFVLFFLFSAFTL